MKTDLSRRDFLRRTAAAGAAVGVAGLAPSALSGLADAATPGMPESAKKLVVYGVDTLSAVPAYKALFKKFEAMYNVTIQYTAFSSDKFVALFTAAQASGEQIDVLLLNGQDTRRYALAGDLMSLDQVIDTARFVPSTLAPFRIHGKLWSLPGYSASELVLAVNKYWLDRVHLPMPKTYADMVTLANKLRPMGVSLLTHEGGNKYLWPIYFFMAYAQTTGNKANARTVDTLVGTRKFTDPEVVQALTILQQMAKDQLFTPDALSIDFPGAAAEFLHGKAAMYFQWGGMIGPVNTAPKPKDMDLMITYPPRWVGNSSVMGQLPGASYPAMSVYAKSRQKNLALKFIDYLTGDGSAKQLCASSQNLVSSNRGVTLSGGYPARQIAQIKGLLPRMFTYMDWTWPPEVTGAFQTGIQGIIAGQQTPTQVATTAQQTLDGLRSKGYKFQP